MHAIRTLSVAIMFILFTPVLLAAKSTCTPLVLSDIHVAEETAGFMVDVRYPVLCVEKASRTIRDWVGYRLFDFKKFDPDHDLSDFPHKYDMTMNYSVWSVASGRLASVKLDVDVYTGGAHPNHWPMTWVFDMANGDTVTLEELISNMETTLPAISVICRAVLVNTLDSGIRDMILDGTEPLEENFSRFILNDEGVTFIFPHYQVAPYSFGEQVVTIPYANITKHLTPEINQALGLTIP
ncbi:DUF3298 domain-containing protein [uncultured Pseudodesulfovibrio sp.]|uniref:DUF3298 and DUF4163 domain-containing protein n=1 Tax=uncultured Pseudodesulfovibrio sp. TaxID=2035858 RepID=UPI0029C89DE5|nr:DUF3298 domain-containing protein [uncultured Pseudodesulfovibrio sp.]